MKKARCLIYAILAMFTPTVILAEVAATASTQPVYTIHTSNDTVWVKMSGTLRPTFIASKMENPYNGNITFDDRNDTLVLIAGRDTVTILPTTEIIRLWIYADKDTVAGILNCSIATEDVVKLDTAMVALLRHYSAFGNSIPAGGSRFEYAGVDDSNLASLRTTFHLDSIAGSGDEFSRQRNLLRWVHTRIRHDGNSTNPSPANADHIIAVCDKENRGVNCRMLGTTLNEVYLAMGYKSRHLTCLPYDTLDQDCHVINMVWSTQYNKWLYMDPTNDAYWMDRNRTPLSPLEVRHAMEIGDSLITSDSVNWNGQPQSRQYYYNYIAKNLFRFMAPAMSSYGYESNSSIIEIALSPTDYRPDLVGKTVPNKSGTAQYQYTDNTDWFFAPPK